MGERPPPRTRRPARVADPARRVAYDVALAVDVDAAYANLLLPRLLRERALAPRDRAFATELAYGTLRWQGVLDEVLATAARRDVAALDPPVRAVLRLGAYQLLHLATPSHAAVHATVEMARVVAGPRPTGLVNAVLRKVSQADWPGWVARLAPADPIGRLAFAHGHPRWVAAAFADALGGDLHELQRALAEDRPTTHLVARPGRSDRAALVAAAGPGAEPGPWSPYAVRLTAGGDPAALADVRSGAAGVQDEGSQLAALALAGAPIVGAEHRWLDLCAGPGGKSALLEAVAPDSVAVLSGDVAPHRAQLVARARREPGRVAVADGTRSPWRGAGADRVLVDAPCTGLGALRRRPEVRWRRRPGDLDRLVPLQRTLLVAAADAVRPGGIVAYVTCSPHPAETTAVVDAVLAVRPDLRQIDAWGALPMLPRAGTDAHVQLWPHRHGTDAMFVALLARLPG